MSDRKHEVISDTGTSWIGAPYAYFLKIMNTLGAEYDFAEQLFVLNCSAVNKAPNITFTIGERKYEIPPVQYILDVSPDFYGTLNNSMVLLWNEFSGVKFAHCKIWPLEAFLVIFFRSVWIYDFDFRVREIDLQNIDWYSLTDLHPKLKFGPQATDIRRQVIKIVFLDRTW